MSRKIKLFSEYQLFENKVDKIYQKYLQSIPELPITHYNIHQIYNKVPVGFRIKTNKPYIPGMYKVFRKNERKLNESILKFSKPLKPKYIINALQKKLYGIIYEYKIHISQYIDKNDIPGHIIISMPFREVKNGRIEMLEEIMNTAGYYLAYYDNMKSEEDGNIQWLQFEPYYWELQYETVEDIIYHVTSNENAELINNKGFIAKNSNTTFKYPPRNYFFNFPDSIQFKSFALTNDKIDENKEFSVIKVDTIELDNNITFYSDPNFIESHGIYTYENISNKHIIEIIKDTAQ